MQRVKEAYYRGKIDLLYRQERPAIEVLFIVSFVGMQKAKET
jgi:hypothetical protein